jgi:dienelactone hydrolase
MLVSGSEGGLSEVLASLFAAHGVAGFALAYFNYETLPKALLRIPIEYFGAGVDFLQRHPAIDGERLAIGGGSRGGELSLLLGSMFPQFKAAIAWVPSGLVWAGIGPPEDGVQPAWMVRGRPVPFMDGDIDPSDYRYVADYHRRGDAIPLTPGFLAEMRRYPDRIERATIPVERINGAVLLISGEDDQMWPSTRLAEISMERFRVHHFPHPCEHVRYADVGHAIAVPPYFPTIIESRHPVSGALFAFGGKTEANAHAAVDAWRRIRGFLREHL